MSTYYKASIIRAGVQESGISYPVHFLERLVNEWQDRLGKLGYLYSDHDEQYLMINQLLKNNEIVDDRKERGDKACLKLVEISFDKLTQTVDVVIKLLESKSGLMVEQCIPTASVMLNPLLVGSVDSNNVIHGMFAMLSIDFVQVKAEQEVRNNGRILDSYISK